MRLEGSCHCRAVRFSLESRHVYPFMHCYCSICRKTQGGGGYAINLSGDARSLEVVGRRHVRIRSLDPAGEDGIEASCLGSSLRVLQQPLEVPSRARDDRMPATGIRGRGQRSDGLCHGLFRQNLLFPQASKHHIPSLRRILHVFHRGVGIGPFDQSNDQRHFIDG